MLSAFDAGILQSFTLVDAQLGHTHTHTHTHPHTHTHTHIYIYIYIYIYKGRESKWEGAIEKKIGWVSIFLCEMMHHWLHITLHLKSIGLSGPYSGSVRLNTFPCDESKDNILPAAHWSFACGPWAVWRHSCMTGLWWTNTRYHCREGAQGHLSTSLSLFIVSILRCPFATLCICLLNQPVSFSLILTCFSEYFFSFCFRANFE